MRKSTKKTKLLLLSMIVLMPFLVYSGVMAADDKASESRDNWYHTIVDNDFVSKKCIA